MGRSKTKFKKYTVQPNGIIHWYMNEYEFTIVGEEDFNRFGDLRPQKAWSESSYTNTVKFGFGTGVDKKYKLLHRLIMDLEDSNIHCYHIDRNGLNNLRTNLLVNRPGLNYPDFRRNGIYPSSKNEFRGVTHHTTVKPNGLQFPYWKAYIMLNRKQKHLGTFPFTDEGKIRAAKRHDEAVKEYFPGNTLLLNFPLG